MQPHQDGNNPNTDLTSQPSSVHSFSPFTTNLLEVDQLHNFLYGCAYYSQKHNMIIACPSYSTVQFYNASTLLPLEDRETLKLDGSVKEISFQPENDVFILRCLSGSIYSYNASLHVKEKLLKDSDPFSLAVEFVNSKSFAVSSYSSKDLHIGTLDDDKVLKFDSRDSESFHLHRLPKSRLLLASLEGGSLLIYCTNKLPDMKIIGQFQAEDSSRKSVAISQSFVMNGKEFVVTIAQDKEMKIWNMQKGKMRLIKVIKTEGKIGSWVYLEDYNMIAVIYEKSNGVEFFRFPSGKLEKRVELKISSAQSLFLMKDKDMIGVTSSNQSVIEFIQLS